MRGSVRRKRQRGGRLERLHLVVRIAPGWRAVLYRDDGFKGEQLEITADVPNLTQAVGRCSKGGFNDCVTSIRVFRPQ